MGVDSFEEGQLGALLTGRGDTCFHATASSTVATTCTSRFSDCQSCNGRPLCVPRFASVSGKHSLENNRKKPANSLDNKGVIFSKSRKNQHQWSLTLIYLFTDSQESRCCRCSPLPLVFWLFLLLLSLMGYCGSRFITPAFVFWAPRRDEVALTCPSLVVGKAKPPYQEPQQTPACQCPPPSPLLLFAPRE